MSDEIKLIMWHRETDHYHAKDNKICPYEGCIEFALIDPQELQRLRKIEEWAKEAYAIIAGEWSFSKFLEEYDAIITEAKHDKD